ncbi:MAG TPA: hypothetical protein VHF26_16660 [Trebonia sp.]|nr:hypothetical protein [Trebonia sp.]
MHTLLTRGMRSSRTGRGLAALGMAAAAVVGCSGTTSATAAPLRHGHVAAARSCSARPGWAAITLADTSPVPAVTVPPGGYLVVTVPHSSAGTATDVHPAGAGILREQCTVLLPGHGRRTIFRAARSGSTSLGATVEPASGMMMPAWRGEVTVRTASG